MDAVQPPGETPPPIAPAAAPSSAAPSRRPATMMRVDTRLLDDLMDQVGELVTANGSLLEVSHGLDSPRLHGSAGGVEGLVKALQQQAMKLRMMPLEMIADRFPRAVRDLARKRGKEVTFEVLGKETELDRAILEELPPDPAYPAECHRSRIGRPRSGCGAAKLRWARSPGGDERARERGDTRRRRRTRHRPGGSAPGGDGPGCDQPRAGRVAVGFRSHDVDHAAGFSTAKEVTDVSGRGVGMDVVRGAVESLRGSLVIESVINQGTTFTLERALTLVGVAVLLVAVGEERYALPVSTVEQSWRFALRRSSAPRRRRCSRGTGRSGRWCSSAPAGSAGGGQHGGTARGGLRDARAPDRPGRRPLHRLS